MWMFNFCDDNGIDEAAQELRDELKCTRCKGRGAIASQHWAGGNEGWEIRWHNCPDCGGSGLVIYEEPPTPDDPMASKDLWETDTPQLTSYL